MKKFGIKDYPNIKLGTKGRLRPTYSEEEKDYILGLYFSGVTIENIRKQLKEEDRPVPAAITLYGYTGRAQKLIDSGEKTIEEMTAAISEDKKELVKSLRTRSRGKYELMLKNKIVKSKSHMHGPEKMIVREAVREFANSHTSEPMLNGVCISLPGANMLETIKYFDTFNLLNDSSHYLFFESDPKREKNIKIIVNAWENLAEQFRDRTTFVVGDIINSALITVPDNSVTVFDLDFMCIAEETFMKALVTFMIKKGGKEYYAFINNSVRGGGYERTAQLHKAMIESMNEYYGKDRVKSMMCQYSDTSPMLTTSIVIKKGETE